jgi:hypothetical protein
MRRKIEIDKNGVILYSEITKNGINSQIFKPGCDTKYIKGQLRHIIDAIHTPGIVQKFKDN